MRLMTIFTMIFSLVLAVFAGTPVMDGLFDGEDVWGSPAYIADGVAGWAGANAKKIYITDDANYIYFGAEVSAAQWMSWCFIVNTKDGGGNYDSWQRAIDYAHPNLPDYAPRGTFGGYAELNYWDGSEWQGYVGLESTEFADTITVNDVVDGWVEIRIPKDSMGTPNYGDVQFYITGDHNEHGNFDACPDDDNATAWDMSGNHNILKNYRTNVPMNTTPAAISSKSVIANTFELFGNFPNPFNPNTMIRFVLPQRAHVTLKIFTTTGRMIYQNQRSFSQPGEKNWQISSNVFGANSASGIYLYSLSIDGLGVQKSGKMILLK